LADALIIDDKKVLFSLKEPDYNLMKFLKLKIVHHKEKRDWK